MNECRRNLNVIALLALTVSAGSLASAQVVTASLSGTVTDETGAVVPGAIVETHNQKSVYVRTATSGESGIFSFSALDSGDYTLTITAKGFKPFNLINLHLDPGDTRTINNIHMAIGAVDEEVTVEANETSLDTGERSSVISAETIQKLSTEGRDLTELVKILPGSAIAAGGYSGQGSQGAANLSYDPGNVATGGAVGSYSLSGSPLNGTTVRSDGNDVTGSQNVNAEFTSEVKVQQSNFGADVANGPIVIDVLGKSGGSILHGSVYLYSRYTGFNSNDAFAKEQLQPKPGDRYFYPGLTLSGPVRIPHTHFNDAKKLTFYVGAEEYAQRKTYAYGNAANAIVAALVPTANMRKGDLSWPEIQRYLPQGRAGTPGSGPYYNINNVPTTGSNGSPVSCNGQTGSDCLSPYLDAGAMALINNLLPLPNVPGGQNISGYNYSSTNLTNNDIWQGRTRVDYAPNENTKFYTVYNIERGSTRIPQALDYFGAGASGGANQPGGSANTFTSQNLSLNWSTILNPTTTNEAYLSASYFLGQFVPGPGGKATSASIGYPYQNGISNGSVDYPQLLDYNLDGLPISIGQDYSYGPVFGKNVTPELGDNLTKVWQKHTVKFGVQFSRPVDNEVIQNGPETQGAIENYYTPNQFPNNGRNWYSTCYTPSGYCPNNNLLGSFMEGEIFGLGVSNMLPREDLTYWREAVYVMDDWKVNSQLSITFGLRAEHIGNWTDKHGIGAPVFNPKTINAAAGASLPLPGFNWHALDASVPLQGFASRLFYYQPRAGFSYDLFKTGKTILSGGAGQYRFHDQWRDIEGPLSTATGYRSTVLENSVSGLGLTLGGLGDNSTVSGKSGLSVATNNLSGANVTALSSPDSQKPLTTTYSLTIMQEVHRLGVVSAAYVGNRSQFLLNDGSNQQIVADNINAIPIGTMFHPDPITKMSYTPSALGALGSATVNDWRPYPNYGDIDVEAHTLYANYNALQLVWNKTKGKYNYGINYTWSKTMGVRAGFANGTPADAINLRHDYGPLNYDRSQIFNAWYHIPIGHQFRHNKLLKQVANKWELSGYTGLQSGPNQQAIDFLPNFNLGGSLSQPNASSSLAVNSQSFLGTPDVDLQPVVTCDPRKGLAKGQYMNGACFGLPAGGGVNGAYNFPYIHGPAYFQSDLTVMKRFNLHDASALEVRAAAFNFLNHPLPTFSGSYPTETTLTFQNAASENPALAKQQNSDFGFAAHESGRRVMEVAVKYTF